ncbi:MAG: hypothetical protein HZB57_01330, partial [Gammaproteobacteria bacterium]|nr:hypothetical protein [Gammaproteobacteria bacterium]
MRWLILIACLCGPVVVFGHSGHNHGAEAPNAPAEAEPRFSSTTAHVTLVGILKSGRLWLYADDPASAASIDGLKIDVDVNGSVERAAPQSPGTYSLQGVGLTLPGKHALVITVLSDAYTELLTATLTVPPSAATVAPDRPSLSWDKALPILLAGCLAIYLGWRKSHASSHPSIHHFTFAVILGSIGLCSVALSSAYILYTSTSHAATIPGTGTPDAASAENMASAQQPDT